MFKKLITILLTVVISISCCVSTAHAAEATPDISIMSVYVNSKYCSISVSGTTATCVTEISGKSSVSQVSINQTLQRKDSSGRWQYITNWNKTYTSSYGKSQNSKSSLSSGTYRQMSQIVLLVGTTLEHFTLYSEEVTI